MRINGILSGFLLTVISLFFACGSMYAGDTAAFVTIEKGYSSGIIDDRKEVITDHAAWTAFWDEHTSRLFPPPEIPVVDFDADMVVAVFLGEQVSGGYAIEVIGILEGPDSIIVGYAEEAPSPDAMVTTAMSQPFHLIRTARSSKPVTFQER